MSQPRPDASWPRDRPGPRRSDIPRGTANPWASRPIEVPASGRPREVAGLPPEPSLGVEWPPDIAEPGPDAEPGPVTEQDTAADQDAVADQGTATGQDTAGARRTSGQRRTIALTGRGAIAGMLVLFFFTLLVASWLQWGGLAGASFVIVSVAAAWYTKRRDLLTVAVSPPLLFFGALICVKALTAKGSTIVSTVAGTALTLANVAPWLFAGVILYLIVAWVRGLPQCVTELRHDLRPDLPRPRPGNSDVPVSQGGYRPGSRRAR